MIEPASPVSPALQVDLYHRAIREAPIPYNISLYIFYTHTHTLLVLPLMEFPYFLPGNNSLDPVHAERLTRNK